MRLRRGLRIFLIGVAAVVVLAGIAVAVVIVTFNADAYKPRIEAALSAATGRAVTLRGPIGLAFSLHPTIEARDVTIANPPGFSRPEMARIGAIDLRLDLLPLINRHLSIRSLVLVGPDILLEQTAAGGANWRFTPVRGAQAAPQTGAPAPASPGRPPSLAIHEVRITGGRVGYRDGRTGRLTTAEIPSLSLAAAAADAPLVLDGSVVFSGVTLRLAAQTASLPTLLADQAAPVKARVSAGKAVVEAKGRVARPLAAAGYDLAITASIPDLAALAPLVPVARLPALHDVALAAHVADRGGKVPTVSALTLRSGAGDLSGFVPGLRIEHVRVAAPAMDQPVTAELAGSRDGVPVTLAATIGAPAALFAQPPGAPLPVDITAASGASRLAVKGTIADPRHLAGIDVALTAATPDLGGLSGLVGRPLPKLTGVTLAAGVRTRAGARDGVELRGLKLTTAQGDIGGSLSLRAGQRPAITGQLTSDRLDVDAVRAALPHPPAAAAPAPQPAAPAKAPRGPDHLIPDEPLPLGLLRAADADLRASVGTLTLGGDAWKSVSFHLVLKDGRLRLEPFKATLPAGALDMALTADATQAAPPVTLRVAAPAIGVRALLAALGQPGFASGTADLQADLRGAGNSPHAIAASLNGTLRLSMTGGTIDTRVLEQALGPVMARVNPAGLLLRGGSSEIRCVAVRVAATGGVAEIDPLLLSSSLITVDGSGSVNLGNETVDLHLHPQGRIGGTGFSVPVTVSGPLGDPRVALNEAGVVGGGIQAVIGALAGGNQAGEPSCAAAIAAVNGEKAPRPAAQAPAAKPANPADILRRLLR